MPISPAMLARLKRGEFIRFLDENDYLVPECSLNKIMARQQNLWVASGSGRFSSMI